MRHNKKEWLNSWDEGSGLNDWKMIEHIKSVRIYVSVYLLFVVCFVFLYACLEWHWTSGYLKQYRKRKVSNVGEMKGSGQAWRRKWIFTKSTERIYMHMHRTDSRIRIGVILTKILIIDIVHSKCKFYSFRNIQNVAKLCEGKEKTGSTENRMNTHSSEM